MDIFLRFILLQQLDSDLKRTCEEMIIEIAKAALEPLTSFLLKVSAFRIRKSGESRLSDQPFANAGTFF